MGEFSVITLGNFICEDAFKITLESSVLFLDNLTNKHLKKIKITVIDKKLHEPKNQKLIEDFDLGANIELVHLFEQDRIIQVYQEGSILFIPCKRNLDNIFKESFSYGLPVLTFDLPEHEELIDHTCGLLIEDGLVTETYSKFAEKLQVLHFDPDARAMLKKGAKLKYENEHSWGRAGSR